MSELTPEEQKELSDSQSLYEMTKSKGWEVITEWLEDLAFHSWVDPREVSTSTGMSKAEWEWRELNAFHAANNAKELLERVSKTISRGDYLEKVKAGEIKRGAMKI